MNILENEKKSLFMLFFIYMIANTLLLLNIDGIYWDDWELYQHTYETYDDLFSQVVGPLSIVPAKIHYLLMNIGNGVISYRIATFVLYFMSGYYVYKTLKSLKILNNEALFFVTLFFLIAPLYSARIALIDFPYTLFLFIFFVAFYLLTKYLDINRSIFLRVGVLLIFFFSFVINSLLVFYALALMYIFFKKCLFLELSAFKKVKLFTIKYLDFILLPILFFVIKSVYFVPMSNMYLNYNSINIGSLLKAPINILKTFYTTFFLPITESLSLFDIVLFPLLLIFIVFDVGSKSKSIEKTDKTDFDKKMFYLGVVIFIFGVFAYIAVGKIPNSFDWGSRLQLLAPLGFSFMLYFGVMVLSSKFGVNNLLRLFVLGIFIFSFVAKNLYDGYRYNVDWFYQVAIEKNFKESDVIRNNTTFIITIQLEDKFANDRTIRFYELNSIAKKVFGDDARLLVGKIEEIDRCKIYKDLKQCNFSSWIYQEPKYLNIVENTEYSLNTEKFLKLMYYNLMNKDKFNNEVKNLIFIRVI